MWSWSEGLKRKSERGRAGGGGTAHRLEDAGHKKDDKERRASGKLTELVWRSTSLYALDE
jgi:hypothetical protein